jgi:hypothetical protein
MRLSCLLLMLACEAAAQNAPQRGEGADARELRREALVTAQERTEPHPLDYRAILGVAYTDAESGETRWATPFQLRARFNERKTFVKLSGDGYVASDLGESRLSGLANLNLWLGHQLAEGWRGAAGITLPTGGEVGSERGRERVALSYERALWGAWSGGIEAQLVRYEADPAPGESRVRRQLLGQVAYDFGSSRLAIAQLEHSHRPGVLSATVATVVYQWAIGRSAAGPMLGVVSLSHGLSTGWEDDTIEFDLCVRF